MEKTDLDLNLRFHSCTIVPAASGNELFFLVLGQEKRSSSYLLSYEVGDLQTGLPLPDYQSLDCCNRSG